MDDLHRGRLRLTLLLVTSMMLALILATADNVNAALSKSYCRHGNEWHSHFFANYDNSIYFYGGWKGRLGDHFHTYKIEYDPFIPERAASYYDWQDNRCPRH